MEWHNVLAIVLGLYGAGLSTYLWLVRHRRKIKVILEFVSWVEAGRLIIVNSGYRPVTILGLRAVCFEKHNDEWIEDPVPSNALLEIGEDEKIPATLKDGEHIELRFTGVVTECFMGGEDKKLEVTVYDAEGNEYKSGKFREFDVKWGGISDI